MKNRLTVWINKNKFEFLALLVILLAAAFLRLYKIAGYMTFLGVEGRDVLVVKRMIVDHKWTLLGPNASVAGFFLGPIYYYFMIPFLWAFRLNPVGPAVMVALFGVATVFLVHKVGRDFFNFRVGLLAAGLYAISPLVITYSRSSWNPNLVPFFSLLTIWLLWQTTSKKDFRILGLIGFLLGIAIQLHYLTIFLIAIVGFYFFFFGVQRRKLKSYFWLIGGFLAGWSPFLLFELRHRFPNFRTLYRFILFSEETGFVFKKFIPIVSDVGWRLFERLMANKQQILTYVLFLTVLPIFVFNWFKEKKDKSVYALLGFWLILGVLLFGFYQDDIYDYYFSFMFPLPFLLTAFALEKIAGKKRIGLCLAGLLAGFLVWASLQDIPFRRPPNRQLEQVKEIARFVFERSEGKPLNFALITGSNSDHAYRYFLDVWGNSPTVIENPQVDPERETVTDQLFVVCETLPCSPEGHPLWEIAGFGRAEIVDEGKISFVKIYKLRHL